MNNRFSQVLYALVAILFFVVPAFSLQGDDYLSRAAAQFREKNFSAAYTSSTKASNDPHRSFVRGMAALRIDKYDEAISFLAEAEQKLPLIADYAAYYQAEAFMKMKNYPAAYTKANSLKTSFAASRLVRNAEKLSADALFESGDHKGALAAYQAYIEKYPAGGDSVEAGFQSARCREAMSEPVAALVMYRSIWLNSPSSPLAEQSLDRMRSLERQGCKPLPYKEEELLKRASSVYATNRYRDVLKTLEMISVDNQPPVVVNRIDLRAGMANYRLKQYKQAEKHFIKASESAIAGLRSEARFWLAKTLERQGLKERALALYLELAGEGKKQEFADDALSEAAGLQRGLGQYAEAARLYEQAMKLSSDPKIIAKSAWDSGWSRYLAGDYAAAATAFKGLLADESQREKALYWLGRALENSGDGGAVSYYRTMLEEFPAGFYATWYREQKGVKDSRESLGNRNAFSELPIAPGFEKPRLLASLGMIEDARSEVAALRRKNGEKKAQFPALARIYIEMREYGAAVSLFMQNRPIAWEKNTLPLWTIGYPVAYTELVSQNAALNGLSEGLVYALIRAESGFSPAIKSHAGAIGLMQMMPATAKMTAREKGVFDPQRLTVPEYNIRLGTKHLNDLMKEHNGDVVYMAAAYNAGSAALERWKKSHKGMKKDEFIESIPYQETRDYVKKVYASAATYRQLYSMK